MAVESLSSGLANWWGETDPLSEMVVVGDSGRTLDERRHPKRPVPCREGGFFESERLTVSAGGLLSEEAPKSNGLGEIPLELIVKGRGLCLVGCGSSLPSSEDTESCAV